MIILDEKMPPPPPYVPPPGEEFVTTPPPFPPPFPYAREPPRLDTLPPHLLLRIVYATFTDIAGTGTSTVSVEKQRKTLYWLNMGLRLVNRALYVACMHVLRSTYLPAYASHIRAPYTSDPFPLSTPALSPAASSSLSPYASPIHTLQRETHVLDRFIALKVREDVWADESELHLARGESFRDLFDLLQPRARLEDLVRVYGVKEGAVTLSSGVERVVSSVPVTPTTPTAGGSSSNGVGISGFGASFGWGGKKSREKDKCREKDKGKERERGREVRTRPAPLQTQAYRFTPLHFSLLSASFSSRKVGLVLTTRETRRKRTIVEVERARDERLEASAKKLVKELVVWLSESY
ncbi:hypothetical protein EIP86_000050 [Pleurotus ostreatoroseus]|nr:hypothetical protein EIP86_000050 [Pleurotus ostreatoroseus]